MDLRTLRRVADYATLAAVLGLSTFSGAVINSMRDEPAAALPHYTSGACAVIKDVDPEKLFCVPTSAPDGTPVVRIWEDGSGSYGRKSMDGMVSKIDYSPWAFSGSTLLFETTSQN